MDLNSVSVHKHAKKELGQYPAILTSHLVNNPYILSSRPQLPNFITFEKPETQGSRIVKEKQLFSLVVS